MKKHEGMDLDVALLGVGVVIIAPCVPFTIMFIRVHADDWLLTSVLLHHYCLQFVQDIY